MIAQLHHEPRRAGLLGGPEVTMAPEVHQLLLEGPGPQRVEQFRAPGALDAPGADGEGGGDLGCAGPALGVQAGVVVEAHHRERGRPGAGRLRVSRPS